VAIPFRKYLDFGSGVNTYSMENGAGFGFGLCLTLNNVELRWAYSRLAAGMVRGRIPDEIATAVNQYLGKNINQDINIEATDPLVFHNLTLGYRFTFTPTQKLSLAIPLGFGTVIANPPPFGLIHYSLFGLGGHVGFLADFNVTRFLSLGANIRFSVYVTEPDPNLAGAGLAATNKVFDNAVAWLPLLSLGAHLRLHY